MKPEGWPPRARQYVENLAAAGRYHFGSTEAKVALEVSSGAAKVALNRLAKKGRGRLSGSRLLRNYSARISIARMSSR